MESSRLRRTDSGFAVPAKENIVAEIAQMVQQWVCSANSNYRQHLADKAKEQDRRNRNALAERRAQLQEQARAMERLRKAQLT